MRFVTLRYASLCSVGEHIYARIKVFPLVARMVCTTIIRTMWIFGSGRIIDNGKQSVDSLLWEAGM